jgi:CcmD family protein
MKRNLATVRLLAVALLLGLVAAQAVPVFAQPPAQPGGQGEFVPVKDLPAQETIPAAPLVMGAYAFVWVALLVYVWTVWRRLAKVEGEIHDLNARLAAKR